MWFVCSVLWGIGSAETLVGSQLAIVHSLGPTENLKVFVPLRRRHFSSRLFATVLKNGSTTMSQRVNPPYYGEPSGEFAQRSEQLLRIIDLGGEFLVGWRDEPSL